MHIPVSRDLVGRDFADEIASAILLDAAKKLYTDSSGFVGIAAGLPAEQLFIQHVKAAYRVAGTLYFCASTGDDGNSGLLPSDPKLSPGVIFDGGSNGDGVAVCLLDYIEITDAAAGDPGCWVRMHAGNRLFGLGERNTGLYSSTLFMGTEVDIHDVTYQDLPGEEGQHGLVEGTSNCLIADLSVRADASRVCCLSSLGVGSPRNIIVRNVEMLGAEYAVRIEENVAYGGDITFDHCYIVGWTPVRLSSSLWTARFINDCKLVHSPLCESTGLTPCGISASFGGHVLVDDTEIDVRPTAANTSAHGVSTVTNGQYGGAADVVLKNVTMLTEATGTGAAWDCITDVSGDSIVVDGGNVAREKCSGTVISAAPGEAIRESTEELQTDWHNGGRLDALIDLIKAKTDRLGTGVVTYVGGPVRDDGTGDIVQGDSYLAADGCALSWTIPGYAGPNVDGLTGKLLLARATEYALPVVSPVLAALELDAALSQTDDEVTISVDMTGEQSASLTVVGASLMYVGHVVAPVGDGFTVLEKRFEVSRKITSAGD